MLFSALQPSAWQCFGSAQANEPVGLLRLAALYRFRSWRSRRDPIQINLETAGAAEDQWKKRRGDGGTGSRSAYQAVC